MKGACSVRFGWRQSGGGRHVLTLGIAMTLAGAGLQPAASATRPMAHRGVPRAGLLQSVDDVEPGDFQQAQHLLLNESLEVAPRIIALFRSAAERHDPLAEYNLGYCYEQGIGLPRDPVLALEWYRRAAEHARNDDLRIVAGFAITNLEEQIAPAEPPSLEPAASPPSQVMAAAQEPPIDPAPAEAALRAAASTISAASAALVQTGPGPLIRAVPPDSPLPAPAALVQSVALTVSPAAPPIADPTPSPAPEPQPAGLPHSADAAPEPRVEALLNRGLDMLRVGNISAARLFFERAANVGSGPGAVLTGRTYDRRFLAAMGARGLVPDAAAAAAWYRRAVALGDVEASHLLTGLGAATVAAGN